MKPTPDPDQPDEKPPWWSVRKDPDAAPSPEQGE